MEGLTAYKTAYKKYRLNREMSVYTYIKLLIYKRV